MNLPSKPTVDLNNRQLIHIVRRFGPVGGMERYVWELTNRLSSLGFKVLVLCEFNLSQYPHAQNNQLNIEVIELGQVVAKPRWIGYLMFSRLVTQWLKNNPNPARLIHSHERLKVHHITTAHGSPFATVFEKPWWRLISLRVWMQLYLEKRELQCATFIVPNSAFIKKQLAFYYPSFAFKLTTPIVPGVENIKPHIKRAIPQDAGVVAFIGKEWKRKGLVLAANAIAQLRKKRPNLQLHVIGPEPKKIQHIFKKWLGGFTLCGWQTTQNFDEIDVLLHPAKSEAYGMVISEAMAAGVPVVISDVCGAAQNVGKKSGVVLALSSSIGVWSSAIETQLNRADSPPLFVRSWDEVTSEYLAIYQAYADNHLIHLK